MPVSRITLKFGPLRTLKSVLTRNWDSENDWGIYALYAPHPIYAPRARTLVYIGQTWDQPFAQRASQHAERWLDDLHYREDMRVRLAEVKTPSGDVYKKHIDSAERALIYAHAPALNSQNVKRYSGPMTRFEVRVEGPASIKMYHHIRVWDGVVTVSAG